MAFIDNRAGLRILDMDPAMLRSCQCTRPLMRLLMQKAVAFAVLIAVLLAGGLPARINQTEATAGDRQTVVHSLLPRQTAVKPLATHIHPDALVDRIVVKLVEGIRPRIDGNGFVSLAGRDMAGVNGVLSGKANHQVRRMFGQTPEKLEKTKFLLETRSGRQVADMNGYFVIDVSCPAEAEALINRLNALPEVEIAYPEPKPEPTVDIDPPTPAYDTAQSYLWVAPGGIDADYAHTIAGGTGIDVTIADIEGAWKLTHEDLELPSGSVWGGTMPPEAMWRDHGTAVVGMLAAGDNGYGMVGIAPQARIGLVSIGDMATADAILLAVDSLVPGDIMLIELNAAGPRYNFQIRSDQLGYVCMEYWQAEFDAIQMAWAKGIIVCEAAGNGAENLDDVIYENRFDTTYRNSHAILVGAGAPPSGEYGNDRSRLSFSNYGARVNLQGHGAGVVTCGYGDLFSGGHDERQYYTATFAGTSSALPVVAGAAASLQGICKARYDGAVLDADEMRDILIATGSPQQGGASTHIGPRPNLRAADSALPAPDDLTVSPLYIDTVIAVGTQMIIPLTLTNGSATATLAFEISTVDSVLKNLGDWLVVPDSTGTIPPSSFVSVDLLFDATAIEDRIQIYKGQVRIAFGEDGGPMEKQEIVPIFLDVPCADTTYVVETSFQPEGQPFQWIDITSTGAAILATSWYNPAVTEYIIDDGTAGPINIGFDFPFYDSVYTKFFIGANGAISFTDTNINVQGYYTNTVTIPGQPFATFIAPFWNDFNLDTTDGGHGAVYVYKAPHKDTLIIEYWRVGTFKSAADTLTTFEVIIDRRGDITFQYLSVDSTILVDSALIGVAAAECMVEPFFAYGLPAENRVGDSTVVKFERMVAVWDQSGDVNNDRAINVGDAVYLINYIFRGGPLPVFPPEGDVNCDSKTNVGDAVYIINYVFRGGPAPCMYRL